MIREVRRTMMKVRIITSPDPGTMEIIYARMRQDRRKAFGEIKAGAVALVQDSISDIIYYADVAAKSSNVKVAELIGNCPQSIMTVAIFGEISAVKTAVEAIKERQ